MSEVSELLVYQLVVDKKKRLLRKTLTQFNKACIEVATYADRKCVYNSRTLSALLSADIQKKYGLPSGIAECAVRRVSQDFTALNKNPVRGERRTHVPSYLGNKWMLCSKDTASVIMEAMHPSDTQYPTRVSLRLVSGREKFEFERRPSHIPQGQAWHARELRLYSYNDGERWQLEVALQDSDGENLDWTPDYQDPDDDHMPSEDLLD